MGILREDVCFALLHLRDAGRRILARPVSADAVDASRRYIGFLIARRRHRSPPLPPSRTLGRVQWERVGYQYELCSAAIGRTSWSRAAAQSNNPGDEMRRNVLGDAWWSGIGQRNDKRIHNAVAWSRGLVVTWLPYVGPFSTLFCCRWRWERKKQSCWNIDRTAAGGRPIYFAYTSRDRSVSHVTHRALHTRMANRHDINIKLQRPQDIRWNAI